MNKQTLIILGGGLVAALIVALMMQALIGTPNPEPQAIVQKDAPKSEVLVAARDLGMGSVLEAIDMRWQPWPTDALFKGAVTRDSLENPNAQLPLEGQLRRRVAEGEPLLRSALVGDSDDNYVASTLGEGKRAVAISINAETSVGGFIKPGDKVDVIMTYSVRMPNDPELSSAARSIVSSMAAQTVLENVKVMAVDQTATEMEGVSVGRTVTLEVTPEQSEKLALAARMGDLSLSLRKLGDESLRLADDIIPSSVTDLRISNVIREVSEGEPGENKEHVIRLYSGNTFMEVPLDYSFGLE